MDDRAIGVFDSGLGGLTAAKVIEELLPSESIVYFGDSGRMPYGGRSVEDLRRIAVQNAAFVGSFGVKAMVVACGSMSAWAMDALRAAYPETPFFSVEDAACDAVVAATCNRRVGVIATEASIRNRMFELGIRRRDPSIEVLPQACPSLAAIVEQGHFRPGDAVAEEAVRSELAPFVGSGIDTLLLGCTHYPLLSDIIRGFLGEEVRQISCGAETARSLAAYLQEHDMLITVDEEGGRVGRLMYTVGTTRLSSMFSYRELGEETAYQNAATIAEDLKSCGFNTDFAPVADVWSNMKNSVIGDRAYSNDFDEASELVASAVRGFRDSGVICCLKHFPGHGSTLADSHEETAVVDKTPEELKGSDLKPFVSGIEAGADMVMVGQLTVPAVDEAPATMSRAIITDLLRHELGFEGVVITDGLQMAGAGGGTDGEKAVKCLSAGCDLLLEVSDVPGTVAALKDALAGGTITQEQVDESVLRVLRLKLEHGIL